MNNKEYWESRQAELKICLENGLVFETTVEDLHREISGLKEERSLLLKKLQEIENLSRYAWEQVEQNPEEAKELFKEIHNWASK